MTGKFISGAFALTVTLSMVTYGTAATCDLAAVRDSAQQQLMGGWRAKESNHETVQKLVKDALQAASASNSNVRLAEAKDVIEAYGQVVAGNNYCIVFRASGNCGDYHCQSFECTASGHQPLSSDTLTKVEVECKSQDAVCDIQEKRQLSEKPMPGGWHDASQDEFVGKLHETAAAVAKVTKGSLVEAYSQVVAGKNYCIHFTAAATGNCGNKCPALSCTAGGHKPLSSDNSVAVFKSVGVSCRPLEVEHHLVGADGSRQSANSSGRQMSTSVLAAVLCVLAAIIFG
jgi:hypothetical protein